MPTTSMFIDGVFYHHNAACMHGVDARMHVTMTHCNPMESAPITDVYNLYAACMQPVCSLYAACIQVVCSLNAACMHVVCRQHAACIRPCAGCIASYAGAYSLYASVVGPRLKTALSISVRCKNEINESI